MNNSRLTSTRHALDIASFARDRLGFHPDRLQSLALDPSLRRGLLNCSRQWGKSTTVAIRAVHHAVHHPESLTIVAAPCARQSGEFVRKARALFRRLDLSPRGDGDNEISLQVPNGARIVGLPGREATTRGFSNVSLLLIDEAARVPDDLYQSLRPMVATNADAAIWLMSTPNGRQGFFYQEWTDGGDTWTRIAAPATECPRILPSFLDEERRTKTDQIFRQEYLCEFIAADGAYFDPEGVEAAFRFSTGTSQLEYLDDGE
jgi:Terminase large subunit, T4likevirus-type, N-terminal